MNADTGIRILCYGPGSNIAGVHITTQTCCIANILFMHDAIQAA